MTQRRSLQDHRPPANRVDPAHAAIHRALEKTVLWLALAVVSVGAAREVARTHRRRALASKAAPPRRLQTWEGEGGRPDADPPPPASAGNPVH